MNREVSFRGKRVDNGEWVEGNHLVYKRLRIKETNLGT